MSAEFDKLIEDISNHIAFKTTVVILVGCVLVMLIMQIWVGFSGHAMPAWSQLPADLVGAPTPVSAPAAKAEWLVNGRGEPDFWESNNNVDDYKSKWGLNDSSENFDQLDKALWGR